LQSAEVYLAPNQLSDSYIEVNKSDISADKLKKEEISRTKDQNKNTSPLDPVENEILRHLEKTQNINDLLNLSGGDSRTLLERLCQMELEGKVIITGQKFKNTAKGRLLLSNPGRVRPRIPSSTPDPLFNPGSPLITQNQTLGRRDFRC
jgi:hypothetical protein